MAPTLIAKARVEIPAGIQSGKVLRLRGKGIPGLGGREPGDQLVRVIVVIPTRPSADERRLFEELGKLHGGEQPKLQKGFFERMRDAFGG